MSFIIEKYKKICDELALKNVTLVAVTKTKPVEDILEAYHAGQRDFAENYVQELIEKEAVLPKDIRWHFIGHLQTNKVKYIAPFIHLVHSVDSEKLLLEINRQGKKSGKQIPCLLQVHISAEETKFGLDEAELKQVISNISKDENLYEATRIMGLMGMASFSEDNALVVKEFSELKKLYDQYSSLLPQHFSILSMGMSADYGMAVECGSNLVRIGSILFGSRINTN